MKILVATLAVASLLSAADLKVGKPLTLKEPISVGTLVSHSDEYSGKTVQVEGKITEVCQAMGCWLDLVNDEGQKVRINAHEGGLEFPKDSVGKMAVAEGIFSKSEMTRDEVVAQAKEEAKEKGKNFDPASIKKGMTMYEIKGTGAVIVSK